MQITERGLSLPNSDLLDDFRSTVLKQEAARFTRSPFTSLPPVERTTNIKKLPINHSAEMVNNPAIVRLRNENRANKTESMQIEYIQCKRRAREPSFFCLNRTMNFIYAWKMAEKEAEAHSSRFSIQTTINILGRDSQSRRLAAMSGEESERE